MNISRLVLLAFGSVCLPGILSAQTELIPDDKFSDGGAAWILKVSADTNASMTVVDDSGEQALFVEVPESPEEGKTPPDVRFQRLFGEISAEKNYRVSFQAKAAEAVKIIPYIYPENEGARVLWRAEITLEPDWKEFSYTLKGRETADNCVLGFSHLGKMANKYWFKNIVLTAD